MEKERCECLIIKILEVMCKSQFSISLLNGNELVCYPKSVQPQSIQADGLEIDTTGKYFGTTKPHNVQPQVESEAEEANREFFLEHAFFFFRNAEKIMSDSRMFLAPVPIVNGIAYSGTAGFTNPTLGVFVEWWLNCETDVTHDNSGKEALCYAIAGSPLTGINGCGCVYPDGTTERIVYGKFSNVWRTFVQINQRYTDVTHDHSGKEALCYAIAGSPLTGINGCGCVYPDGTTERIVFAKFSNVWRTFVQINQRYTEVKQIAEAYSLQEVYDKLK